MILLLIAIALHSYSQSNVDSTKALLGNKLRLDVDTSLSKKSTSIDSLNTAATAKFDTVKIGKKKHKHSVGKAVLFSAVLPGLGQAYNKKYWKIPIVYAGFGGLSYAVYFNATNYQQARAAYRSQVDKDNTTNLSYNGTSDASSLKEYRDYYRKNLELSGTFMGVWYLLNLIDAAVDAHLFHYDISDKLSMRVQPMSQPSLLNNNLAMGATLSFHF